MNRRAVWTIFGVVIIAGFIAFGAGAFKSNLTPYVSFQQARSASSAVQVAGKLVPGSDRFDEQTSRLLFTLENDKGDTIRVAYKGLKPGNFNEAKEVVAIGRYNGKELEAEQLLVKCPSKYQGLEDKGSASASS